MFKTKTKTFIFVLEAPRDQDPGLEDYITVTNDSNQTNKKERKTRQRTQYRKYSNVHAYIT